jgi:hypothetical protein
MKTLARLTAIILIFVGLLTALGGVWFVSRGLMQTDPFLPALFGDDPSILFPLRLLVGGSLILQGLMTGAVGEGLWLLTGIASNSQRGSEHLAGLAARGSMTIP